MITIKVLYVASECSPFVKSGGLADVAGALPKALKKVGCHVRVVLPKYRNISSMYTEHFKRECDFTIEIGNQRMYCGIDSFKHQNLTYYFVDHDYFNRDGIYGYDDEGARFALFSKAVLEMIHHIRFKPDIIHINDWHAGVLPLFLKEIYQHKKEYQNIKTVLTIHNIYYQGSFDRMMLDYCMLSQDLCTITCHDNRMNFLKTAILLVDKVTTVSPTYAKEIKSWEFSEGLDYALNQRKEIVGILNGLDTLDFNPKKDHMIKKKYDINHIDKKKDNKEFLQNYFNLPTKDIPIVVMISRLVKQKGLDIIMKGFHEMMTLDCQFILLGCGEHHYEHFLYEMSRQYHDKFKVAIEFNNSLARFIYAGGDFFLMPSLFEPCGLSQLIAMRYGTIPIVRKTGGLKDTVVNYNEYTKEGYGFGFDSLNEKDMINVLRYAFDIYYDKERFKGLIKNAMKVDFSWEVSAENYKKLYENLTT